MTTRAGLDARRGPDLHVPLAGESLARALCECVGALVRSLAASARIARLEAELLIAHVLERPRSHLLAHPGQTLTATEADLLQRLLARRCRAEPLAYLLGEREFWSLPLHVDARVLIPRPETELVVERCLSLTGERGRSQVLSVADLGTGSGAIAIALASERPGWRISATDSSAAALEVAADNLRRLRLDNVVLLQGDWFEPLSARRFALIAANPPYVAAVDPALEALKYEPLEALTPGQSGFEALRHIVRQAPAHLVPRGALVLEHGEHQAAALERALVEAGFARVRCHRDLAGRERVTEAEWPD